MLTEADFAPGVVQNGQQQQQQQQQQQPEQPQFDFKEFGYDNKDALSADLQRLRSIEEEEKSDTPYIKELRKAARSGISVDDFNYAQSIDLEKMNPLDKVSLSRKLKNPSYSKEDAAFLVSREFNEDERYKDMPDDQLPDDVRESRIKLRIEAAEADKFLNSFRADALTPPLEKNLKTWGEKLGSTISEGSVAEFTLDPKTLWGEESGEPIKLTYKSDNPELPKQLQKLAEQVLAVPGVPGPNEEGVNLIKSAVQREFIRNEMPKILNHFISEAIRIKTANELKAQVNPSVVATPGLPKGDTSDPDRILLNAMTRN